jgi:uncharacterized protein
MSRFVPVALSQIDLHDPTLLRKRDENRSYLMRLENLNLVRNHLMEAGLWSHSARPEGIHGGWESPTCQLRGHFVGHWLSAAAIKSAATGDRELEAKALAVVDLLAECQEANGGGWVGSIPEKYLDFIARGRSIWAPHYTLHKTLMGLLDMHAWTGNEKALETAVKWAGWFKGWTDQFSREEMDTILEVETGGMLETWVDLYERTGDADHRTLIERYTRRRLFDPLLEGKDVLTNMHANTTIPEVLGAARAFEVLAEQRWFDIVAAYWDLAVTKRGQWATGGQTCGEIWTPMHELSARLGDKNQEHCTVYNMMRLADFLFRHTGETRFADYWEQNLVNGVMAQGHWQGKAPDADSPAEPEKALLTYFLPLRPGSVKQWASETEHFFCCHGSLVQANAAHTAGIWYGSDGAVVLAQHIPSSVTLETGGTTVRLTQSRDTLAGSIAAINETAPSQRHTPDVVVSVIGVRPERPVSFTLQVRVPWWVAGETVVTINGEPVSADPAAGWIHLPREWHDDTVRIEMPKKLSTWALSDRPDTVAFMDGPTVLAGLCDEERTLYGSIDEAERLLVPDNEREWVSWTGQYRVIDQERGLRFVPLNIIGHERYTVYFPIRPPR